MRDTSIPPYLSPYLRAVRKHGAEFPSLLWASPTTQASRFDAISRLCDLSGRSVLDVGCGRADLLDHLLDRGIRPAAYVGIEAVDELASAAEARQRPGSTIVRADFVSHPQRMFVDADVVIFSGSLNTVDDPTFYSTLRTAFNAASGMLIFNFLSSPLLAGRDYLHWRSPQSVIGFVRGLSHQVQTLADYLRGDCTVALQREQDAAVGSIGGANV